MWTPLPASGAPADCLCRSGTARRPVARCRSHRTLASGCGVASCEHRFLWRWLASFRPSSWAAVTAKNHREHPPAAPEDRAPGARRPRAVAAVGSAQRAEWARAVEPAGACLAARVAMRPKAVLRTRADATSASPTTTIGAPREPGARSRPLSAFRRAGLARCGSGATMFAPAVAARRTRRARIRTRRSQVARRVAVAPRAGNAKVFPRRGRVLRVPTRRATAVTASAEPWTPTAFRVALRRPVRRVRVAATRVYA